MRIVEKLAQFAGEMPDKSAVIFEGEELTFSGLWNESLRCAHLLKKLGVQKGDRVICQCSYGSCFLAARFAAHLCGAVFVSADKDADLSKLADLSELLGARLVIFNGKEKALTNGICYDDFRNMLPDDTSMNGLSFPEPDSISEIVFTTGTTGASKGVQLTHRNMMARALSNAREFGIDQDDICITSVPLNHIAPMMLLDMRLSCGGTIIFLDGMKKLKLMFDYMDKYGVTTVFLPPTGIALMQMLSKNKLADYADRLKAFHVGSAAMTKPEQEYLERMLPHSRLQCCYASSECGVVSVYEFDNDDRGITCCGKPTAGIELQIVDDEFRPVPTGNAGLIAIKSDTNMLGYYKRPELNDSVFYNGYYISNDMGCLDEDGFLYVLGRSDDMINIGGLKVYPSEVENAVLRIPGIEECLCFGVPDPITGQAVKLLIKPGETFCGSVPQVQDELSKSMDQYKVPKNIEIVTEIRKTANGKPDRKYYQSGK